MDFLAHVTEARSCRRFDGAKELPEDTLHWLVDCARLTPSAGNMQVTRYLTVSSPAGRQAFYPSLAWAGYLKEWDGPVEAERPTGYLVFMVPKEGEGKISPHAFIDLGITAQTIQLAAWSKGIAACMFRAFNPKKIAEAIAVPEGHEITLVMALGYPVEERHVAPVGADGSIRYYRDDKGAHFVPKRALNDIILGDF